jgi:hypothetical protein
MIAILLPLFLAVLPYDVHAVERDSGRVATLVEERRALTGFRGGSVGTPRPWQRR